MLGLGRALPGKLGVLGLEGRQLELSEMVLEQHLRHVVQQYVAALIQALCVRSGAALPMFERVALVPHPVHGLAHLIDAPNSDIFDVLAYVRFTLTPLSRSDRAEAARATSLGGYETEMRAFLDFVLRSYEVHGIDELAPAKIADFLRIRYGGTNDAKRRLGPVPAIRDAFVGIQSHLFR
jgi:hypothetical protein